MTSPGSIVERDDLVLIAHGVDVGHEFEAVGVVDVRVVVDELARHESAAPPMRADDELDAGGLGYRVE